MGTMWGETGQFELAGGMRLPQLDGEENENASVVFTNDVRHTMVGYAYAALSVKLMQVDGPVLAAERRAFHREFAVEGVGDAKLRTLIAAAARDQAPYRQYARQLAGWFGREERGQILRHLCRVAVADAPLTIEEYEMLTEAGKIFGYARKDVVQMIDDAQGPTAGNPYLLLNVDDDASEEEIHRAYRERMRHCHPDRWGRREEYKEMYHLAHRRSVAVNAAYDALMRERRLH